MHISRKLKYCKRRNNLGININGKKIDICVEYTSITTDSNKDQAK